MISEIIGNPLVSWWINNEISYQEIQRLVEDEIVGFNKEYGTDMRPVIQIKYLIDIFYRREIPSRDFMSVLARVIKVERQVLQDFFKNEEPWSWVIKKDEGESKPKEGFGKKYSPLKGWKLDNNYSYFWIRDMIRDAFKVYIPHHEKAKSHYTREYIVAVFNGTKKPGGDLAYCLSKMTKIPLADIYDHILHRQHKEGLEKEEIEQ